MEQVLVGQLENSVIIRTLNNNFVSINSWYDWAVWSYLRLHKGKKIGDRLKEKLDGERMNTANMTKSLKTFPKRTTHFAAYFVENQSSISGCNHKTPTDSA